LNDTLGRKEMFPRNQRLNRADLGGSPAILGVGLGLWPRVYAAEPREPKGGLTNRAPDKPNSLPQRR
jgi:hypothetical protein